MNFDDFTYTERTFTDVDQLVDIIIDLKLNQSYFVDDKREHDPTWNRINIKSNSRIMIVFLYADEQGSLVASKLLYGEDYVVFLLNQNNMGSIIGDSNIHSTNDFLKTNANILMSYLQKKKGLKATSFGVNYFLVVHIKGDNIIYKMEFDYFYNNYVMKYYK